MRAKGKKITRDRTPLTAAERRRVEAVRAAAEADKARILARGRQLKRQRQAAAASLRDTCRLLQEARQAQGVTLQQLEDRTGIGSAAISRLENDPSCNPTIHTLQRIAMALGKQVHVEIVDAK